MNALPAAVSALALCVAGCGTGSPESEIAALFEAAEEAAEARDAGFFADLIGESYRDARGNDRDGLVRAVRGYFLANQRIEVVSLVDEIVLEGKDAARAVVHAGLAGQRTGAAALGGLDADLYRFELELVRSDGDWRIIGAEWRPSLGE